MGSFLRLDGVSKAFGKERAVDGVSLEIGQGEFFTLLGPSGCGKSTLLRLISGHEQPDAGRILLRNQDITHQPAESRPIHTVFQQYALFPHLNVWDNVAFGLRYENPKDPNAKARVETALEKVHMAQHANSMPHTLSGGQQQRVAIARALIKRPAMLLLDEPMSALDHPLRQAMRLELKNLQHELGITFLLVTHDQEEALSLADHVALMQAGRLLQVDTPRTVYEKPATHRVAQFIGAANFFQSSITHATDSELQVHIEGVKLTLPNRKGFTAEQRVEIMVRPEDLNVWDEDEIQSTEGMLPAHVHQVIYKGSTVDLVVELPSGQRIHATEFFDENDENLIYQIGQKAWVDWIHGWETLFDASIS